MAASAAADEGTADWTLMIYDVADTENIADEMIRNLAAFAQLPEMPNVHVVALVDLPEQNEPGLPALDAARSRAVQHRQAAGARRQQVERGP